MSDDGDGEFEFEEDEPCEEEPEWEVQIEDLNHTAEGLMTKQPDDALKKFHQVIADDQDKGKWTFGALQGIYKTCLLHIPKAEGAQKTKYESQMLEYYRKMLQFKFAGRHFNDVDKAVNEMVEKSSRLEARLLKQIYQTTVAEIESDLKTFDKLWFKMKYRLAQVALQELELDDLTEQLRVLHDWCGEGERAAERKSTQLLGVYALEIQLYTERFDPRKIREIYQAADDVVARGAMPDPKVLGVIRESGGKMYMRQAMWMEAYDCMFAAFRSYEEASDNRKIACLKYLVVTKMMSDADINPFDTNEAKAYQQHPEIVAVTQLLDACDSNDLKSFDRVMKDSRNQQTLKEDRFLSAFLEPLIRKLRMQVLKLICKPYKCIRVSYVAEELMVTEREAESLCISMILDSQLAGALDQTKGVIILTGGDESGAGKDDGKGKAAKKGDKKGDKKAKKDDEKKEEKPDRYKVLRMIAEREGALHASIATRAMA